MKTLIIGLSYDMKNHIFDVLLPKASSIFHFYLRHIGMEVNKPWKF